MYNTGIVEPKNDSSIISRKINELVNQYIADFLVATDVRLQVTESGKQSTAKSKDRYVIPSSTTKS